FFIRLEAGRSAYLHDCASPRARRLRAPKCHHGCGRQEADYRRIAYNSCRDRHCPKCQAVKRAEWLESRLASDRPQRRRRGVPHYYVDEQEYIGEPSKFASIKAKNLKVVRKNSTVELPLGIFNDASHAHISAVLFNSSATWGKVRAIGDAPYSFIYFSAVRSEPSTGDCFVFPGGTAAWYLPDRLGSIRNSGLQLT